jgi:hypothetical protein
MGSWHCSGCRKACKVTVSKAKAAETVSAAMIVATLLTVAEVPLAS